MTLQERLNEELNRKDEEIERLKEERDELQRRLDADPYDWAVEANVLDRGLPIPRLEIEWTADPKLGWGRSTATYRLVWKHFLGHVTSIGLSRTVRDSGTVDAPINPKTWTHRPGKIDLPLRDGAHICHDMAQLCLPGYAICGEQVDDLSELKGRPGER